MAVRHGTLVVMPAGVSVAAGGGGGGRGGERGAERGEERRGRPGELRRRETPGLRAAPAAATARQQPRHRAGVLPTVPAPLPVRREV